MLTDPTIAKGSLVLITGANGLIGSHCVEVFLAAGYKVRGVARSASKLAYLKARWDKIYGVGAFEIAVVNDFTKDGAFDDALKGVSGVIHVAGQMTPTLDPNQFIDPAVKRIRSLLRTAANQPTVKSFVLTSSSSACTTAPNTNIVVLDKDTWNEQSVEQAYSLPDSHPMKPWQIYSASKTLVEQAAWKFVKEENPGFILNTVLPCANFGPILDSKQTASTAGWVRDAYTKGDITFLVCPQWFVDVRDTALLHLHALTSPTLSHGGNRIWAAAALFNVNDILGILRKLYPEKSFPADLENPGQDLSQMDNKPGTELLGGWRSLEESIKANTEGL